MDQQDICQMQLIYSAFTLWFVSSEKHKGGRYVT